MLKILQMAAIVPVFKKYSARTRRMKNSEYEP